MTRSMISTYNLETLFHYMESGRIAVPAFQRPYVWTRQLVKELFVSINKDYPIGIIVAFQNSGNYELASPDLTLFPNASEEKIRSDGCLWIVDGIQRLASLYNVLFSDKENLSLFYDLRSKEFLFPEEVKHEKVSVLMSDLFNIDKVMKFQHQLIQLEDSDELLE